MHSSALYRDWLTYSKMLCFYCSSWILFFCRVSFQDSGDWHHDQDARIPRVANSEVLCSRYPALLVLSVYGRLLRKRVVEIWQEGRQKREGNLCVRETRIIKRE